MQAEHGGPSIILPKKSPWGVAVRNLALIWHLRFKDLGKYSMPQFPGHSWGTANPPAGGGIFAHKMGRDLGRSLRTSH